MNNIQTKMNNIQVDDAQKNDVVRPMYNVIDYSDAYLKTSESLWQYYTDEPALNNNGDIIFLKIRITVIHSKLNSK